MCHDEELNLKQVATQLDVHYMTAYRYVRAGRLPARRQGNAWLVRSADLAAFRGQPLVDHDHGCDRSLGHHEDHRGRRGRSADWAPRLGERLGAGDEAGAWTVVEAALASAWAPEDLLLDVLVPAVALAGDAGGPAASRLAVTTAQRTSAVLTARFRRRGRRRGSVVLGAPRGEHHALAITVLTDLLRLRNLAVLELGIDAPAAAFAAAAAEADRLVAVGVSVTTIHRLEAAAEVVDAIRRAHLSVPVLLGGQGARNPEVAALTGATAWAPDGRAFVDLVEAWLPASRPTAARGIAPRAVATSQQ